MMLRLRTAHKRLSSLTAAAAADADDDDLLQPDHVRRQRHTRKNACRVVALLASAFLIYLFIRMHNTSHLIHQCRRIRTIQELYRFIEQENDDDKQKYTRPCRSSMSDQEYWDACHCLFYARQANTTEEWPFDGLAPIQVDNYAYKDACVMLYQHQCWIHPKLVAIDIQRPFIRQTTYYDNGVGKVFPVHYLTSRVNVSGVWMLDMLSKQKKKDPIHLMGNRAFEIQLLYHWVMFPFTKITAEHCFDNLFETDFPI